MKAQGAYTLNQMVQAAKIAATADGLNIQGPAFKVIELTSCPDKLLFACERIEQLEKAIQHTIGFVESTGLCTESVRLLHDVLKSNEMTAKPITKQANEIAANKIAAIDEIKNAGIPNGAKYALIGEHKFTLEGAAVCPECVEEYDQDCEFCHGESDEDGRSDLAVVVPWDTAKEIYSDFTAKLVEQLQAEVHALKTGQVAK